MCCAGAREHRAVAPALVLRRQAAGRPPGGGGGQGDAGLRGAGDRELGAAAAQLVAEARAALTHQIILKPFQPHASSPATVKVIVFGTREGKL